MYKFLFLFILMYSTTTLCMEKKDNHAKIWDNLITIYTTHEDQYSNPQQAKVRLQTVQQTLNLIQHQLDQEEFKDDHILWAIAATIYHSYKDRDMANGYAEKAVLLMKEHTESFRPRNNTLTLHRRAKSEVSQSSRLLDTIEVPQNAEFVEALFKNPDEKKRNLLIDLIKSSIVQATIEIYQKNKPPENTPPQRHFFKTMGTLWQKNHKV